jgi:hypothetical protein
MRFAGLADTFAIMIASAFSSSAAAIPLPSIDGSFASAFSAIHSLPTETETNNVINLNIHVFSSNLVFSFLCFSFLPQLD